jgi:hypothetical protein
VLNPLAGLFAHIALVTLKVLLLPGEGVTEVVEALLGLAGNLAANTFYVVARIAVTELTLAKLFVFFTTFPASHRFTSL